MIGTSLNQYRITASIGAGGMGEVFRARDTRLNRDVAIKVLPKDFVSDADRLRRFEHFDFEAAHADALAVVRGHAVVSHRRAMRGVKLRAGAGGQFREAAGKVSVRMRVENGGDFQTRPFGVSEVIVYVALGVNDRRLAVRAEQIGGVGEALDEVAFEKHGVSFHLRIHG